MQVAIPSACKSTCPKVVTFQCSFYENISNTTLRKNASRKVFFRCFFLWSSTIAIGSPSSYKKAQYYSPFFGALCENKLMEVERTVVRDETAGLD